MYKMWHEIEWMPQSWKNLYPWPPMLGKAWLFNIHHDIHPAKSQLMMFRFLGGEFREHLPTVVLDIVTHMLGRWLSSPCASWDDSFHNSPWIDCDALLAVCQLSYNQVVVTLSMCPEANLTWPVLWMPLYNTAHLSFQPCLIALESQAETWFLYVASNVM